MLQQLKTVLDCLPQPAFVRDTAQICLLNEAAAALELLPDAEQLFYFLPSLDSGPCHCVFSFRAASWDATVRPVSGMQMVILQRQRDLEPQILASAARNLREPLQRMLVAARHLWPYLEEQEDERIQMETAAINRGMHQMLRAVGNLADLERAEQKMVRFRQRVECNVFMVGFEQQARPLVESTGHQFIVQCQAKRFYALMDVQAVERALLNLLANAIAHAPTDSQITMRAFSEGKRCCFAVTNTGEIVAGTALAGMLAPYTSEENALFAVGAGFGLQIVRNTAQSHGGSLLLQPNPAGGLTVVLSVEAAQLHYGESEVHCPLQIERSGGFDRYLTELSDVLEDKWFDTRNID